MCDSKTVELENYLAEKARKDQEKEQDFEPFSEYEACVLKESDRVRKLIAKAQNKSRGRLIKNG